MAVIGLEHVAMPGVVCHLEKLLYRHVRLRDVELKHVNPFRIRLMRLNRIYRKKPCQKPVDRSTGATVVMPCVTAASRAMRQPSKQPGCGHGPHRLAAILHGSHNAALSHWGVRVRGL